MNRCPRFLHYDDEPQEQKLDLPAVLGQGQVGVHAYTCGPSGFMEWVIGTAKEQGYSDDQVHREYFQADIDSSGASFEVVASRSGKTVTVELTDPAGISPAWQAGEIHP